MITAAAIRTETQTYTGRSHADAIYKMMNADDDDNVQINGFITDDGRFLNRVDAYTHADELGQLTLDDDGVQRDSLQSWMVAL